MLYIIFCKLALFGERIDWGGKQMFWKRFPDQGWTGWLRSWKNYVDSCDTRSQRPGQASSCSHQKAAPTPAPTPDPGTAASSTGFSGHCLTPYPAPACKCVWEAGTGERGLEEPRLLQLIGWARGLKGWMDRESPWSEGTGQSSSQKALNTLPYSFVCWFIQQIFARPPLCAIHVFIQ